MKLLQILWHHIRVRVSDTFHLWKKSRANAMAGEILFFFLKNELAASVTIYTSKRLIELKTWSTYLVRYLNPLCLTGNWEHKCCGGSGAQSAYYKAEIYLQALSICLSATSLSSFTMYIAAASVKPNMIISQPTCQTTAAALWLVNQTRPFWKVHAGTLSATSN